VFLCAPMAGHGTCGFATPLEGASRACHGRAEGSTQQRRGLGAGPTGRWPWAGELPAPPSPAGWGLGSVEEGGWGLGSVEEGGGHDGNDESG
jgi:hypothetical protein